VTTEISRPVPFTAIQLAFNHLPQETKNDIYRRVWEIDGKPLGDPQYGQHHVCDKKERLYTLLPRGEQERLIKHIFDEQTQRWKEYIYSNVWEKDGKPLGDPRYGEHHAFDDLEWLSSRLSYQHPLFINCVEPGERIKTRYNPFLSNAPTEYPKHGIYRNGGTHPHLEDPYGVPCSQFGCIKLGAQKAINLPESVKKVIQGKQLTEINVLFFNANEALQMLKRENAQPSYHNRGYGKHNIPQDQELPINLYFHGVVYPDMKLQDRERKQHFPFGIFSAQGEARWFGGWGGAAFEELQPTEIYAHKLGHDAPYISCSPNNARLWVKNSASFYSVLINGDKAHVTLHVSRSTRDLMKINENQDLKIEDIPALFPGPEFVNLRDLLS